MWRVLGKCVYTDSAIRGVYGDEREEGEDEDVDPNVGNNDMKKEQ